MVDFTLSSGSYVRPYRSPWGAFPVRAMPMSSGVSSLITRVGDRVGLDVRTATAYHKIKQSSALSTAIVGYVSDTTQTADQLVPVWEANPMVEFRAVTKNATLLSTHVGMRKGMVRDSTLNVWYIDLVDDTEANKTVIVTELIDAVGDSGGYVAFKHLMRNSTTSSAHFLAFYK